MRIDMKAKLIQIIFLLIILTSYGTANAFEVTGETFDAEFKVTSWEARDTGSTVTSVGYLGDKYGKVYLTHNLKLRVGADKQGNFTGQLRSINKKGKAISASLQGTWKRSGKVITIYTLDEFSSGLMLYAQGTFDLIEGTIKFKVFPIGSNRVMRF